MVREVHKICKSQGYDQGQSDHTLFTQKIWERQDIYMIVYVDDIILTRDESIKANLANEFEIKDLG